MKMMLRFLMILVVLFALCGAAFAFLPLVAPLTETNSTVTAYTPRKVGDVLVAHAGYISNLVTITTTAATTNYYLGDTNITAAVSTTNTVQQFTNVVYQSTGISSNDWKQLSN